MTAAKLHDVAEVISGQHLLAGEHNVQGRGVGYLTGPADFGVVQPTISRWTERPKALCEPGDVLVTVKGAGVGKVNLAPDATTAIGRQLMAVRGNSKRVDAGYLLSFLSAQIAYFQEKAVGATVPGLSRGDLEELAIPLLSLPAQRRIAARLKAQLGEVDRARQAAQAQLREVARLADSVVLDSVRQHLTHRHDLGDVLHEIKQGIGAAWAEYPVLGATRDGLAPAKEPPGKHAPKYKPAFPGTVFYNPMRILIGSIAFVDDDDTPGITSPDYVALQGQRDKVDSRWFYHWLRSPLGAQCILSLARGAVRERMLFNRLSEGEIELPSYSVQQQASAALKELKPLRRAIESQLVEIDRLPKTILSQVFE